MLTHLAELKGAQQGCSCMLPQLTHARGPMQGQALYDTQCPSVGGTQSSNGLRQLADPCRPRLVIKCLHSRLNRLLPDNRTQLWHDGDKL